MAWGFSEGGRAGSEHSRSSGEYKLPLVSHNAFQRIEHAVASHSAFFATHFVIRHQSLSQHKSQRNKHLGKERPLLPLQSSGGPGDVQEANALQFARSPFGMGRS